MHIWATYELIQNALDDENTEFIMKSTVRSTDLLKPLALGVWWSR